ncbi:nucleotidyltransferase-like protein [Rubeoparvulum massiliense]|uniref:nucleotidyltransferase-like protein n=1 Tax=Rubeoparvulum massiliense TaxID=1631346 RepID=UPI00065E0029|nr:nucleotidyltransferase-like protein [Rubeoparvulum massiliense]
MEQTIQGYIRQLQNNPNILSILLVKQEDKFSPISDGFDALLIVITNEGPTSIQHYVIAEHTVQEIYVNQQELENWFYHQRTKRIVEWIFNATVLYEKESWFTHYHDQLHHFPEAMKERKICIEFSAFLRRYMAGKDLLNQGYAMDAYSHIVHALHHWARILLIENGLHPEVSMWNQVRLVDQEIYKLYCELIEGDEPLAKRLQLLLLASQFSVNKLMRSSSRLIQHILSSRKEPWTIEEIADYPLIQESDIDLSLLMEKLVEREIVFACEDELLDGVAIRKYYV